MGKGGYIGGSTVVRGGSDWFTYSKKRPKTPKKATAEERAEWAAIREKHPDTVVPEPTKPQSTAQLIAEQNRQKRKIEKAQRTAEFHLREQQKRLNKNKNKQTKPTQPKTPAELSAEKSRKQKPADRMAQVTVEIRGKGKLDGKERKTD